MMNNTMNEKSPIDQAVMRRVRRIALLRILISGGVFAFALILLGLYGIGREVWVGMVFQNGPQTLTGHALYLLYAFEHTRFVVQGLVLICVASFIFLARELVRFFALSSP